MCVGECNCKCRWVSMNVKLNVKLNVKMIGSKYVIEANVRINNYI